MLELKPTYTTSALHYDNVLFWEAWWWSCRGTEIDDVGSPGGNNTQPFVFCFFLFLLLLLLPGGVVYRGTKYADVLDGKYLFADFQTG